MSRLEIANGKLSIANRHCFLREPSALFSFFLFHCGFFMSEPLSIETIAECPLELLFKREGDRWSHEFQLRVPDATQAGGHTMAVIARSIEGSSDQPWPASSPIQEVNKHGDYILLGVGMAGNSHWSASCSVESGSRESTGSNEDNSGAGSTALLLDLACLRKDAGESTTDEPRIGSTYLLGPDVTAATTAVGAIKLSIAGPQGKSCCVKLTSSASARAEMTLDGSHIRIVPAEFSESPVVATRWAFRLETG